MRPKEPQPTNPSPQKSLVTKNFAHKNRPFSHHPTQKSLPHNFPMPKITLPKSLSRRITLTHKSIAPKISIPKNFAPIISIPNKILPKCPYPEIPPTRILHNPKVLNPPTHMSLPLNTRNPKSTQLKSPYPKIPTTHKSLLLKFYPTQTIAPKIPRANYSRAPEISRTLQITLTPSILSPNTTSPQKHSARKSLAQKNPSPYNLSLNPASQPWGFNLSFFPSILQASGRSSGNSGSA